RISYVRPHPHKLHATSSERVACDLHRISYMRPPPNRLCATSTAEVMCDLLRIGYVRHGRKGD
ncbi:hypothetical protein PanWU01x14_313460, partial [Parasponia andersonii]